MIMMFPEDFKAKHNIDVYTQTEVLKINRAEKTITVKDLKNGETRNEAYDKLVLATGTEPVMPGSIEGIHSPHVFTIRNVVDIERLQAKLDEESTKNIAVVGGGFIGAEVAENLRKIGKEVTLIEGTKQILAPYDYDMVQILHKELDDNGITLHVSATVTAIESKQVKAVKDGKEFTVAADAVVMAVGARPKTELAKDAGLEIGTTGGIWVDHNYRTSDADIYAVGDAIESYNMHCTRTGQNCTRRCLRRDRHVRRLTTFAECTTQTRVILVLPASKSSDRMRHARDLTRKKQNVLAILMIP